MFCRLLTSFHINVWISLLLCKTGELVWPVTRQKVLSQTFYWGYVVAFLPCGWLSERMGGKFVLGVAIMCMSLTTSLISLSTSTHYFVLILLRFIAGLGAVSNDF